MPIMEKCQVISALFIINHYFYRKTANESTNAKCIDKWQFIYLKQTICLVLKSAIILFTMSTNTINIKPIRQIIWVFPLEHSARHLESNVNESFILRIESLIITIS